MIAIPDFAAGAMENWGLITYRESALLYTPGVSSSSNKQRVCAIVAHELAHQVNLTSQSHRRSQHQTENGLKSSVTPNMQESVELESMWRCN